MLSSNSIQESSFISTKSKQIQTVLPYGKHDPMQMESAQKAQEDVSIKYSLKNKSWSKP